jgi:hypothetical protein
VKYFFSLLKKKYKKKSILMFGDGVGGRGWEATSLKHGTNKTRLPKRLIRRGLWNDLGTLLEMI